MMGRNIGSPGARIREFRGGRESRRGEKRRLPEEGGGKAGARQCGNGEQRGQKWVSWRGSFGKSGFHAMENRHNLGSMAWKNGEFDFHGVELFAAQGETTTPREGGRGSVRAAG